MLMSPTENSPAPIPHAKTSPSGSPGVELLLPLICLGGLCVAAYLTVLHFSLLLGDLSVGAVCGRGAWGDCNSVVGSRYGRLLGLPLSVWGMGYYIAAGTMSSAIVLLRRADARAFVRVLLYLTIVALLSDLYLAWVMWARLERFCPLCGITYGINALILVLGIVSFRHGPPGPGTLRAAFPSLAILLRPLDPAYYREVLKLFLAGLGVGGFALVVVLSLLVHRAVVQGEEAKLAGLLEYLKRAEPFSIDPTGRPSRGPADAPVTVAVFSDFMCEQCKRASEYLDIVAVNHRGALRVVYLHYPVDAECNEYGGPTMHPGACELARAGACAHAQGRFWEFHDLVFAAPGQVKPERMEDYATRSGLDLPEFNACRSAGSADPAARADIALGHSVGVTVTPTIYLNGRPIVGALKPWMLEAAIETVRTLPLPPPPGENPQPSPLP